MIREKFPKVGVHGLSTSEIDMISKVEKSSTKVFLVKRCWTAIYPAQVLKF